MSELKSFYVSRFNLLFKDRLFRNRVLAYRNVFGKKTKDARDERAAFKEVLLGYIGEAELALSLLKGSGITRRHKILEVGGGMGLVHGFLKSEGYNIHSIEPSESGFEGFYKIGLRLLRILGISHSSWHPLPAKDCTRLGGKFDVIFSNNVLEHVPDLGTALAAMRDALKSDGMMLHNTVNYTIPYEPHFKMLLVPLIPRATQFFRPKLKGSDFWNNLNFVTVRKIVGLCKSCGLVVEFDRGALSRALERLDNDKCFAERQGQFYPIYRFLKKTGCIRMLKTVPISLTTPIAFTARIADGAS